MLRCAGLVGSLHGRSRALSHVLSSGVPASSRTLRRVGSSAALKAVGGAGPRLALSAGPRRLFGTLTSRTGACSSTYSSVLPPPEPRRVPCCRVQPPAMVGTTTAWTPPASLGLDRRWRGSTGMTASSWDMSRRIHTARPVPAAQKQQTSDKVPRKRPGWKKRWLQYGAGLRLLAQALGETGLSVHGFRIEDSALALSALARLRANKPRRATVDGATPVDSLHRLKELRHFLTLAHAAYLASDSELVSTTPIKARDLVSSAWEVNDLVPAHYVAVCHTTQSIVLCVRGTWALADAMLNSCSAPEPLEGGFAHRGTVVAARNVVEAASEALQFAVKCHPMYRVVTIGHSFGGGTATVAAMMLRSRYPGIEAVTFGVLPCLGDSLARSCAGFVTSVINGDDVVPRLHRRNLDKLRAELAEVAWASELQGIAVDDERRQRIAMLASEARERLETGSTIVAEHVARLVEQTEDRLGLLRRLNELQRELSDKAEQGRDTIIDAATTRTLTGIMSRLNRMDAQLFNRIPIERLAKVSVPTRRIIDSTLATVKKLELDTKRSLVAVNNTLARARRQDTRRPDDAPPDSEAELARPDELRRIAGEVLSLRGLLGWWRRQTRKLGMASFVDVEAGDDGDTDVADGRISEAELEERLLFFPPGTVLHLVNLDSSGAAVARATSDSEDGVPAETQESDEGRGQAAAQQPRAALALMNLGAGDVLNHVVISRRIVRDHLCSSLEADLDTVIAATEAALPKADKELEATGEIRAQLRSDAAAAHAAAIQAASQRAMFDPTGSGSNVP